jgi:dTMP kinase
MTTRGAFITFEGGEGSGKSTQIARLAERLEAAGVAYCVLREPGGTTVGELVRDLLLDPKHTGLDDTTELLLYEACRAELVSDVIEPALEAGEVVICDRFYDSTTAYQGFGRGLPLEQIAELNAIATGGLVPDRTIVLDVEPKVGIRRATRKGTDRLESEGLAFHERVRDGFLAVAEQEPGRVRVIDAGAAPGVVAEKVAAALADIPLLAEAHL